MSATAQSAAPIFPSLSLAGRQDTGCWSPILNGQRHDKGQPGHLVQHDAVLVGPPCPITSRETSDGAGWRTNPPLALAGTKGIPKEANGL